VVAALVILDGASEPLGAAPTSLERARTPVLDRLAGEGTLTRVRTVAPGLSTGSETAIPALLGWTPPAAVDRAALEAAARQLGVPAGHQVWRVDVHEGAQRAAPLAVRRAAATLRRELAHHTVHSIGGHRLLICGPPPLPSATLRAGLRVWPRGDVPPRILGPATVVVAAPGAAAGAARMMGATVVLPPGATGRTDTDLTAKAAAAVQALRRAARVVVHVGGPDEASHERDRAGKIAVLERIDGELLGPLAAALRARGGALTVCPDHGCDPASGEHDNAPVPCLSWAAARLKAALPPAGALPPAAATRLEVAAAPGGPARLTERHVSGLPLTALRSAQGKAA